MTNKDVVRGLLAEMANEDVDAMHRYFDDDLVWWVPASACRKFGLERRLQGWANIPWLGGAGWNAFQKGSSVFVVHHVVAEDDLVAAHFNRSAKLRNGGDYECEYNFLFRLADGKIVEVWEIADTAAAFGG